MALIRSRDAAIYYEESGTGDPLILLPGLLGSIESHWRRFIPAFSTSFHTIAVDFRGHGKSDNPSGQLTLALLVEDLQALVETLQVEHAAICGYSLGGYVGLAYGLRSPGTIRSLVMHGTKFYWTEDAVQATLRGLDPEAITSKVPAFGEMLQKVHEPGNGPDGWRSLLAAAGEFIRNMPRDAISESTLSLVDYPVLVSVCGNDTMIGVAEARRLARALPASILHIFEQCEHQMQSVPKATFVEEATRFIIAPPISHNPGVL